MGAFQRAVYSASGLGVPGEIYNNGPMRAQPFILSSSDAGLNVVASAFSITAEGVVQAGNPGGASVLAGLLVNPKAYALYGSVGSPSLVLPNGVQVEIANMGSFVVNLPAAANIGDWVIYDNATGVLETVTPGSALPVNTSPLYAEVDFFTVASAGLAVITMTRLPGVPVAAAGQDAYVNRDGDYYVNRDGDNYASRADAEEAKKAADVLEKNQKAAKARADAAEKAISDAQKAAKLVAAANKGRGSKQGDK